MAVITPKILFYDIETRPIVAEVWGLFDWGLLNLKQIHVLFQNGNRNQKVRGMWGNQAHNRIPQAQRPQGPSIQVHRLRARLQPSLCQEPERSGAKGLCAGILPSQKGGKPSVGAAQAHPKAEARVWDHARRIRGFAPKAGRGLRHMCRSALREKQAPACRSLPRHWHRSRPAMPQLQPRAWKSGGYSQHSAPCAQLPVAIRSAGGATW